MYQLRVAALGRILVEGALVWIRGGTNHTGHADRARLASAIACTKVDPSPS